MAKGSKAGEADIDRAIAARANRNPCHELLLRAMDEWEAEHGFAPAAVLMHPLTLETLESEPKAREWNHAGAGGARRFYGLAVVVKAYEGIPYQLLTAEEARAFG